MADPSTTSPAFSGDALPVLISGASFAGLATAYWMARLGYRVTVVEVAKGLRKGGTPVDIEGETTEVLTRMGLMDAVRAKALPLRSLEFKNADDVVLGVMGAGSGPDNGTVDRYEIHRDDLLDILSAALPASVEMLFGRSIIRLEDGPDGVSVTLDDGTRRDCALVFGCDGNRSKTRSLVFGDFETASFFMGGYFYLKVVPETGLVRADTSHIFGVPGRTAMLNGYGDRTDIGLIFRADRRIDYDHRDRARQRRLVHEHFDGLGWKVPDMLAHVDAGDDFYFDQVNQIRIPAWSKGHVALVGDAGYCVSPVAGMGGSIALIGAGRLADALRRHPGDHAAAFRDYENKLRPFVEQVQERAATEGMSMLFPADEAEFAERNDRLRAGDFDL